MELLDIISSAPKMLQECFARITCYYNGFTKRNTIPSNTDKVNYINRIMNPLNLLSKISALASDGSPADELANNDERSKQDLKDAINYMEASVNSYEDKKPDEPLESVDVNGSMVETAIAEVKTPIEQDKNETIEGNSTKELVEESETKEEEEPDKFDKFVNTMRNIASKPIDGEGLTATEIIGHELLNWGIDVNSLAYKALSALPDYISFKTQNDKPDVDDVMERMVDQFHKPKVAFISSLSAMCRRATFENSKFIPILAKLKADGEQIRYTFVLNELVDFCINDE